MKRAPWLDLAAVTLFVVIGRHNHHHGETVSGIATTWWPFAAGLVLAWVVTRLRRRVGESLGDAALIVAVTVAAGMILRVVAGQGTAFAFVLVALAFLYLFMGGWRWLVHRVERRKSTA